MQKKIRVDIYLQTNNNLIVKGRCLGYIAPREFNALILNKSLLRNAFSSNGLNFEELEKVTDIDGLRLVVAVNDIVMEAPSKYMEEMTGRKGIEIDSNKLHIPGRKTLFITEPLDFINMCPSESKSVDEFAITTKSGAYLTMEYE